MLLLPHALSILVRDSRLFQFPLHRECCCYPEAARAARMASSTFSSLFIGNAAVTHCYERSRRVEEAPFSSLFIGNAAVTSEASELVAAEDLRFQFPLHRECCCYRRTSTSS